MLLLRLFVLAFFVSLSISASPSGGEGEFATSSSSSSSSSSSTASSSSRNNNNNNSNNNKGNNNINHHNNHHRVNSHTTFSGVSRDGAGHGFIGFENRPCVPGDKPLTPVYGLDTPLGPPVEERTREEMEALGMSGFWKNYVLPQKPVVIRGAVAPWPALDRWTDEYLAETLDYEANVESSRNNDFGYESNEWKQGYIPWKVFLDAYKDRDAQERLYASEDFPDQLAGDVMPFPFNLTPCFGHAKFFTETGLWVGSGGQVSLLHNDPEDNILTIVDGRKGIVVFPPNASSAIHEVIPRSNLNRLPRSFTELEAATNVTLTAEDTSEPSSRVSPVDIRQSAPEYATRFPGLSSLADTPGSFVELNRGDALYLPKMWFHEVHSYCRNIAVNYWWDVHNMRGSLEKDRGWWLKPAWEWAEEMVKKPPVCRELVKELREKGFPVVKGEAPTKVRSEL